MKYKKSSEVKDYQSGIYTIVVETKNKNYLYIGSTKCFKIRFTKHVSLLKTNNHSSKFLQNLYNKYGSNSIFFEPIKEIHDLRKMILYEGILIRLFKPELNTCLYPEFSGSPNLGRKLSKEWKKNLNNGGYLHKNSNNIQKIIKNNKEGGTSIKMIKKETKEILLFKTMRELNNHFNTKYSLVRLSKDGCKLNKIYDIEILKTQKKKVKLKKDGKFKTFSSASNCDKYLNLWRGATSNAIINNNGVLQNFFVKYI